MTTLVQLIRELKEELKRPGGGDRELRADVTVAAILSPYVPEPPAPVVTVETTDSTNGPLIAFTHQEGTSWDVVEADPDEVPAEPAPPPAGRPRRAARPNG